ncbi:chlorophyll synthase, chloroplastic-like [Asparagus officinalis]|nr:chlorophyll synthase, chloroplastic-like [Asparagus officinalis]
MASLVYNASTIAVTNNITPRQHRFPSIRSPQLVSVSRRRLTVRAAETDANEVKPAAPDKAPAAASDGSSFNQLLGIKGAKQETVSSEFI